jgi:hypothetical protein
MSESSSLTYPPSSPYPVPTPDQSPTRFGISEAVADAETEAVANAARAMANIPNSLHFMAINILPSPR